MKFINKKICSVLAAAVLTSALFCTVCMHLTADTVEAQSADEVKVVILAGQSNAVGYSGFSYLPQTTKGYSAMRSGYDGVFISKNGEGQFNTGDAFCNVKCGYALDGGRFGPELGMAQTFAESKHNGKVYIVKYAVGGTTIDPENKDYWAIGNNIQERYWNAPSQKFNHCTSAGLLYNTLCQHIDEAIAELKSQNYTPKIEAMCWMQGENDSFSNKRYFALENEFVNSLRKKYAEYSDENGFAFVNGGITTYWPNYYQVNAAKQKNCELLADAEYIDAVGMELDYRNEPTGNPDYAHLDAQSMIKLGRAFGTAALKYFD